MNTSVKAPALWLVSLLFVWHAAVSFAASPPNTLTDAERRAGWQLLFDGQTTKGWRGYKMTSVPASWTTSQGLFATRSAAARTDARWSAPRAAARR